MKLDKTKLNFIAFCGFVSLLAVLTFIGFIVIYALGVTKGFNNFVFLNFFNENKLAILIILIVFVAFDFVSTICIWAIKWQCDWCKSSKLIYGILNIALPFIIPFIFAGVAKAKMKEEREEEMREMLKQKTLQPHISGYIDPQPQHYIPLPNNNSYYPNDPYHPLPGANYYLDNKPLFQPTFPNDTKHPHNYVIIDSDKNSSFGIKYEEKISK